MTPERKSLDAIRRGYDQANREAARIVLADPEKFGPAMVEWARLVMEKEGEKNTP